MQEKNALNMHGSLSGMQDNIAPQTQPCRRMECGRAGKGKEHSGVGFSIKWHCPKMGPWEGVAGRFASNEMWNEVRMINGCREVGHKNSWGRKQLLAYWFVNGSTSPRCLAASSAALWHSCWSCASGVGAGGASCWVGAVGAGRGWPDAIICSRRASWAPGPGWSVAGGCCC